MPLSESRQWMDQQRAQIRERHDAAASGRDTAHALGKLIDAAILRLYEQALAALPPEQQAEIQHGLALVPIGGCGRGDPAPFSDVDLLFLYENRIGPAVIPFAKRLVRDIWDAGMSLGQSMGTVTEILTLARQDPLPATSLLEARLLVGPEKLFTRLRDRLRRLLARGFDFRLFKQAVVAIREEQAKFGATTHLLEPDVKKSYGGLRDLHLLRWLGIALFETTSFESLEERGLLMVGESKTLSEAYDFLLRVRCDLHFHAGKANDSLSRADQLRMAKEWGYRDSPSQLAVELLMQDYFRHSKAVADAVSDFLERAAPRSRTQSLRDFIALREFRPGMRVAPGRMVLSAARRAEVTSNPEMALETLRLAAEGNARLDRTTLDELRAVYGKKQSARPSGSVVDDPPPPAAVRDFMRTLAHPGYLGRFLRLLHETGLLEWFIPDFEHARCLLQFNAYHKYTVDEHTLIMLEHAEQLAEGSQLLNGTYQKIPRKDLLHLAILLHDLGKGFVEDHSILGARMAEKTVERLGLDENDGNIVVTLVLKHLHLSNLAFHRDISDVRLQVQLSRELGSMMMLQMMYVLTAVDIMAVGPGTFNRWKSDLLDEIFLRTARLFGEEDHVLDHSSTAEANRKRLLKDRNWDDRTRRHIAALPSDYLATATIEQIVSHLAQWRSLPPDEVATLTEYHAETNSLALTVMANEEITDGLFAKICAALASHHLEVLSASIHTLEDGTIIDKFEVVDVHHAGPPSAERCRMIGATIRRVVLGELGVTDILWTSRSALYTMRPRPVGRDESRVVVDNDSSEEYTIIDVFAVNRRGLLYTLAKGINRLGLTLHYAKIATYEDEAVDVFYVKEMDGHKVRREDRERMIRDHLLSDITRLSTDPRSMGF